MKNKKIMVLGLGVFGMSVAKTLTEYGQDVLGVDINEDVVSRADDYTTHAVCGDFSSLSLLKSLDVPSYDVIVIAESSNLETSLLTLTHLKELSAKYIIAKAKNKTQKNMLDTLGANLTVKPETEMAERLGKSILNMSISDIIEIDKDYSLVEITVLQAWIGRSIKALNLRKNYGINVVGYKSKEDATYTMTIDPDYVFKLNDHMLVLMHKDQLKKFNYLH